MWQPHPLIGIGGVAILLGIAVCLAALLRRFGLIKGETARKSVHVQLGLIVAAFPWVFTTVWPVWCLAGLAVFALASLRWIPFLRKRLGSSLHDIDRESWGEILFPISVAIAWTLMPGDWIHFSLPILVLTVSDAVAAIIGKRYGQIELATAAGRKSWEGSFAFAGATFMVVHVPLLLATDIGRTESLLIAINMALLLMLVEALAWEGFDNLFIPIAGLLLIDECYGLPLPILIEGTLVMCGLTICSWWWRRHTTLDDAAILTCVVLGYVLWSAGDWLWLLAPGTLFVLYAMLYPPRDNVRDHRALIPMTLMLPGFVWLLVDTRAYGDPRWVIAAAGTYGFHLSAIGLFVKLAQPHQSGKYVTFLNTWLLGQLIALGPTCLSIGMPSLWPALSVAGCNIIGLIVLWRVLPDRYLLPIHEKRWALQGIMALVSSIGVIMVMR